MSQTSLTSDQVRAVVGKLQKLRAEVKAQTGQPSALSELLIELATYNADLGDLLGMVKLEYEKQRSEKYTEYLKDNSNAQAENLARTDLADHRGKIQLLEILHKDITRIISSIQSRLRSLENESKNNF